MKIIFKSFFKPTYNPYFWAGFQKVIQNPTDPISVSQLIKQK
ncbi:hypothetical protein GGR22_003090 [Flavobacterium gossypii]|jgi:hypothetical protein|uniref:Uncharacterized protein n=1 Tax=Flavobacterium gossypii TaxID=1646119 RepID=A0ABR6DT92_9FLAO|nr:hypothetical protein [Flavobacterium gossypii]